MSSAHTVLLSLPAESSPPTFQINCPENLDQSPSGVWTHFQARSRNTIHSDPKLMPSRTCVTIEDPWSQTRNRPFRQGHVASGDWPWASGGGLLYPHQAAGQSWALAPDPLGCPPPPRSLRGGHSGPREQGRGGGVRVASLSPGAGGPTSLWARAPARAAADGQSDPPMRCSSCGAPAPRSQPRGLARRPPRARSGSARRPPPSAAPGWGAACAPSPACPCPSATPPAAAAGLAAPAALAPLGPVPLRPSLRRGVMASAGAGRGRGDTPEGGMRAGGAATRRRVEGTRSQGAGSPPSGRSGAGGAATRRSNGDTRAGAPEPCRDSRRCGQGRGDV